MIPNNIKDAVKYFDTINEDNEDSVLDNIYTAITLFTEHEQARLIEDTKGYEEVGYDNFDPSDTYLGIYTDLYNAMLARGIDSLQFIAFAHLAYMEDENGRTFYKGVEQVVYEA